MRNKFWGRVLFDGCAIFCAALVLISVLMLIINAQSTDNMFNIALSSFRILMLAVFAFVLSFANNFYRIDGMGELLRLGLHFILTVIGFFVCVYSPYSAEAESHGYKFPSENALVIMILFAVLYFIAYGIYKLVRTLRKKSNEKKEEYIPVYKKQSRK